MILGLSPSCWSSLICTSSRQLPVSEYLIFIHCNVIVKHDPGKLSLIPLVAAKLAQKAMNEERLVRAILIVNG